METAPYNLDPLGQVKIRAMHHTPKPNAFNIPVRIYYEDTDAAGIVYYANYLRYFERCRTEWMRQIGHDQSALSETHNIAFLVKSVAIQYHLPARLDDLLTIGLEVEKLGKAQVVFTQHARLDNEELVTGTVQIVCVDTRKMKSAPIPEFLRNQLETLL